MPEKKNENKTKPKIKPKKKKVRTPVNKATDEVFASVMGGNYQPSAERLATAQALITLRGIEIKKTEDLERMLWSAYRACREKVLKTIVSTVLEHKLRLVDAQIIIEMLKNEVALISAWEYEHLDEADDIISPTLDKEDAARQSKTIELFKALGNPPTDEGSEEQ